ncbi:MAG: cell wall-active antibiotics response protein [Tenericutes bacterium]|nr:cell wall-active antibiotics response protein [Mycoplasmatota bacterium]
MKRKQNILWGIVFIILGIVIALNTLGITNINIFFEGWWTLFIIVPSTIDLFNNKNKTGSIIWLLIGLALLLASQEIINFEIIWKLMLPTILVIIGFTLIFKDTQVSNQIKKLNKKSNPDYEYCATFSSQNIIYDKEEFKGAEVNAIFGGVKLDLRKSIIKSDQVINVSAIFGGVDIFVPSNVNVKIKSTPIFGGVSDKTHTDGKKENYTIYINAVSIFGGVDLK